MTDQVLAILESLRDEDGFLHDWSVVTAAGDVNSPLHSQFEWAEGTAAHLYRLSQARRLIRSLRIPIQIGPRQIVVPAFVPVPRAAGTYQALADLAPRSDSARAQLLGELSRIANQLGRARQIAAALDLTDEIDDLLAALDGARSRVGV
jgi:hypothetical protein